jgi:hypothetical protein
MSDSDKTLLHNYKGLRMKHHRKRNKPTLNATEAYSRLMDELSRHGPLRLLDENGHVDLINEQTRLCCTREPFLDVINVMLESRLVEMVNVDSESNFYLLTDKGQLTALLMSHRRRVHDICHCKNCAAAFEEVLGHFIQKAELQLILKDSGHPHLVAEAVDLCCDKKPLLYVLCQLESYHFVEMSPDLIFRLTKIGVKTARLMLVPDSIKQSFRASLN